MVADYESEIEARMEPSLKMPANAQRSDEELVKLARSGDLESINELFTRSYHNYVSFAWYLCRDDNLARDVVHEAYLTFVCRFNELRHPDKSAAWVRGIITNLIRKEWRRAKRERNYGTEHVPEDTDNIVDHVYEAPSDKLDLVDFKKLIEDLPKELDGLDEPYKQIAAVALERFRNGEEPLRPGGIAQVTGIPKRSVYRYGKEIYMRWKRLCEKRGFDSSFITRILGIDYEH